MLSNFVSYTKNTISENKYSILEKLRTRQFYKPKERSPLLRYTPLQAYKILFIKFPLPSISLLNKSKKKVLMIRTP